jgi:hypothetical protein
VQIGAFADRDRSTDREDAGKGDVKIGKDAERGLLDHMAAEPVEFARPAHQRTSSSRSVGPPFDKFA